MRILIADDHELLRDTLVHFLSGEPGIETAVAASLPEALTTVAASGPFDLVLLDYAMPGMEGLDGLARMRAQPLLDGLQGRDRLWFCGSYAGYGFHEDAFASAVRVAARLGASTPWATPSTAADDLAPAARAAAS